MNDVGDALELKLAYPVAVTKIVYTELSIFLLGGTRTILKRFGRRYRAP
jgi:hypothetical protein